jgi:Transposase zinc-ribbon domain
MPVLSHLHHLFNVEQCHTYIHTLRWKDRPLQCPRCQSSHIGQWVLVQPVKTGITPPLAIPSCGQEGEKGRLRRAERLHERQ